MPDRKWSKAAQRRRARIRLPSSSITTESVCPARASVDEADPLARVRANIVTSGDNGYVPLCSLRYLPQSIMRAANSVQADIIDEKLARHVAVRVAFQMLVRAGSSAAGKFGRACAQHVKKPPCRTFASSMHPPNNRARFDWRCTMKRLSQSIPAIGHRRA